MSEGLLKELQDVSFDALTAKEAAAVRAALTRAIEKADAWFASLSREFQAANPKAGRPPEIADEPSRATPPVKSPERRGRPVPPIKVKLPKRRAAPGPDPIAVGGADAETGAPEPAEIFQDSYVSKDGPLRPAVLPPDHPRRMLHRESSVTPEVDMSDFAEVERAMATGTVNRLFGQTR